jgi:Zn finger protein HypA/HybF involved in hydrogenase expression
MDNGVNFCLWRKNMKLICRKCGYVTQAEVHLQICPICKSTMQIIKSTRISYKINKVDLRVVRRK